MKTLSSTFGALSFKGAALAVAVAALASAPAVADDEPVALVLS